MPPNVRQPRYNRRRTLEGSPAPIVRASARIQGEAWIGDGELRGSDVDVSRLRAGVSFHGGGAGVLPVAWAPERAPAVPGVPGRAPGGRWERAGAGRSPRAPPGPGQAETG